MPRQRVARWRLQGAFGAAFAAAVAMASAPAAAGAGAAECWLAPQEYHSRESEPLPEPLPPHMTPEFCCGSDPVEDWEKLSKEVRSRESCWKEGFAFERCCSRSPTVLAVSVLVPAEFLLHFSLQSGVLPPAAFMARAVEAFYTGTRLLEEALAPYRSAPTYSSAAHMLESAMADDGDVPVCVVSDLCGQRLSRAIFAVASLSGKLWALDPHLSEEGFVANATRDRAEPGLGWLRRRIGRMADLELRSQGNAKLGFVLKKQGYVMSRSYQMLHADRLLRRILDAREAWPRWGIVDGVWTACAEGPLAGASPTCRPHHPVFTAFPPVPEEPPPSGPGRLRRDFLGALQPMEPVCAAHFTDANTAGRSLQCVGHEPPDLAGPQGPGWRAELAPFLPVLDEEYFEYVSLLSSVLEARPRGRIVFVEWGASAWAPWAARVAAAWRTGGRCLLVLLEVNDRMLDELRGWVKRGIFEPCEVQVVKPDLGLPAKEQVARYLGPLGRIDLLDMDCQGAERELIGEGRKLLRERVARLHIGTHGRMQHQDLDRALREDGWSVAWSYMPGALLETAMGPIGFLDGVLNAVNPRLGP